RRLHAGNGGPFTRCPAGAEPTGASGALHVGLRRRIERRRVRQGGYSLHRETVRSRATTQCSTGSTRRGLTPHTILVVSRKTTRGALATQRRLEAWWSSLCLEPRVVECLPSSL